MAAKIAPSRPKEPGAGPGRLGERFSVGVSTGILALVLGSILWGLLNARYGYRYPIPFEYVLYFCATMAVLGFLYCENVIVEVFAAVLKLILDPPEERASGWWALAAVVLVAAAIWFLLRM